MMTMNVCAETERLILRRFRETDLQDLHEYLSDPKVVAFEPYKPMTIAETKENLAWRISTDEMIAVELKTTGKLIGNVYLGKRDFDSLEIGFVFNGNYQHQGYARESCEKLIALAFAAGVHRISRRHRGTAGAHRRISLGAVDGLPGLLASGTAASCLASDDIGPAPLLCLWHCLVLFCLYRRRFVGGGSEMRAPLCDPGCLQASSGLVPGQETEKNSMNVPSGA